MKRRYFCPKCDSNLNPNVKIILMVQFDDKQGLLLLSPQPGNYQAIMADKIELDDGELVNFHCPVCNQDLTADPEKGLAFLIFRFSNGAEGTVYFSRKMGKHATYFVANDEVRVYGDDANPQSSMNFFGSGHVEEE